MKFRTDKALMFRKDGTEISDKDWIGYLRTCSIIGGWPTRSKRQKHSTEEGVKALKIFFDTLIFQPIKHPRSTKVDDPKKLTKQTAPHIGDEQSSASPNLRAYDPAIWAAKPQKDCLAYLKHGSHDYDRGKRTQS